jgi:hypothetical protein
MISLTLATLTTPVSPRMLCFATQAYRELDNFGGLILDDHLALLEAIKNTGQHRRVGPQRDPSEPAVIAHWRADPIV